MQKVLVGIDVGTTRIKVVVTDLELNLLHQDALPTPWIHTNNLSEIDMNLLAATAISLTERAVSAVEGQAVSIGVTGFSETGALLGKNLQPIAPGFAWHDPRGNLEQVEKFFGADEFERTVAAKITPVVTLTKILWQQERMPETREVSHFIGAPEWIMHSLGADLVNELSLVSRSGFLDIEAKAPWNAAIELVNGGENFLGRLVGAGEGIGRANDSAPANLRGAALTIAGHDHQTAAYYLGAVKDGALFDSMGTAEAVVRTHKGTVSRDSMGRLAKHGVNVGWTVIPNHQTILAGMPTGISLERISSMLGAKNKEDRKVLGDAALLVKRNEHDLKVNGSYHSVDVIGITDEVTPAHIWRAAVEDLTDLFDKTVKVIDAEVGTYDEVTIAGGWIHNPMVQEAKNKEYGSYTVVDKLEPGAMGAAEFAGIAIGVITPRWL